MKRQFRYILAIAFAIGAFSCTRYEEVDHYVPAPGETVKLTLNATKGSSKAAANTRVHVGEVDVQGQTVKYHWTNDDKIGVIPFLTDAHPNYVTQETQIDANDNNMAKFEAYITAEEYEEADVDLLIYYPYNSSMLDGITGENTGAGYAAKGLTFRLPQEQDQHGYSRELDFDDSKPRIEWHPSDWALSTYGLAYDLAASRFSTEMEGDQTVGRASGHFQLDHANTYFQFNVFGTDKDSEKNYGDGTWKLATMTVQAGYCTAEFTDGEPVYDFKNPVNVAGTYKFSYDYDADDFSDVEENRNNDKISLECVAGVNQVKVTMHDYVHAPSLGYNVDEYVPAFVVINPMEITAATSDQINCLKVSVTCYKVDENGNTTDSDTRIRYYNISGIVGEDIAGNYYTIDFEVDGHVEEAVDLCEIGTANSYIVEAPGKYFFDVTIAGNGQLPYPYNTNGATSVMNIDPLAVIQEGKEYGIDWLWASGLSFEGVDNGSMTPTEVVRQVLTTSGISEAGTECMFTLVNPSDEEKLSGNIVFALYEKNADGTPGEIVWTWHIWLSGHETQHFHFPATNNNFNYTNEDWYLMDRNLGAENNQLGDPRSVGLYYQRSRKEPIIGYGAANGSKTWTANQIKTYRNEPLFGDRAVWKENVTYADYNTFKYPMSLISGIPSRDTESEYYYAWSSSEGAETYYDVTNDTKSMFDPCPPGYKMPTVREWDNLKADKYIWITGGKGDGAFGYSQWEGLADDLAGNTDPRAVDYAARIKAGDKYSVNDQFERTYHIKRYSATGQEIVTTFPNTGILRASGEWKYIWEESTTKYNTPEKITHPSGPALGTEIVISETYVVEAPAFAEEPVMYGDGNVYLKIRFADKSSKYFWSPDPNTANNAEDGDGDADYWSAYGVTYSVYKVDVNGYESNTTTIVVDENGNVTYTIGEDNVIEAGSSVLTVTMDDATKSYFYAAGDLTARVPVTGNTFEINCTALNYDNSGNAVIYVCQIDSESNIASSPTLIQVTKESEDVYSVSSVTSWPSYSSYRWPLDADTSHKDQSFVAGSGERATMALWTAGRVDSFEAGGEVFYSTYWFGPSEYTNFGWAAKGANGEYVTTDATGRAPAPFLERRETYGLTYSPVELLINKPDNMGSDPTPEWTTDPALPVRCIREYDNVSAQ